MGKALSVQGYVTCGMGIGVVINAVVYKSILFLFSFRVTTEAKLVCDIHEQRMSWK